MIVTKDGLTGSIGGGNLEFQATQTAHELLDQALQSSQQQSLYGLGPALNQCCGGAVTLLFEVFMRENSPDWLGQLVERTTAGKPGWLLTGIDQKSPAKWLVDTTQTLMSQNIPAILQTAVTPELAEFIENNTANEKMFTIAEERFLLEKIEHRYLSLYLFGAGHVAKALVKELAHQPFETHWFDSRSGQFPEVIPPNTHRYVTEDHSGAVRGAAPDSHFLVMTHSHELDEEICFEALQRPDVAWVGLIGSITKRRRFEHRLLKRGLDETQMSKLVCPVGLAGITGKRPATIAVSIVAQLLMDVVPENWR
jgi:xanthine dehydrogenase accessory factor